MKSTYTARTGHTRTRYAHKNSNPFALKRRISAKSRLKKQLEEGTKNAMIDGKLQSIPLTDADKQRIKREIATLETRGAID